MPVDAPGTEPGSARVEMSIFRNVTRGSALRACGFFMVLAGAAGADVARQGLLGFRITGVPLPVFAALAAAGGVLFFLAPMVYGSGSVAPARTGPEKELFLYLRPFEIDARTLLQLAVGASTGFLVCLTLLEGIWWPIAFLPLAVNITREQALADALEPLGELVAIGRPSERLQPIGARRFYAGDDWRRQVKERLARARLVIVRPGKGRGIRWEMRQVLRSVPPERILFHLPRRKDAYAAFRKRMRRMCRIELPERPGEGRWLAFDAAWTPRFVREASRPADRVRQVFSRSGSIGTDGLRPVLGALGIVLPPTPRSLLHDATKAMLWFWTFVAAGLALIAMLLGAALLAVSLARLT